VASVGVVGVYVVALTAPAGDEPSTKAIGVTTTPASSARAVLPLSSRCFLLRGATRDNTEFPSAGRQGLERIRFYNSVSSTSEFIAGGSFGVRGFFAYRLTLRHASSLRIDLVAVRAPICTGDDPGPYVAMESPPSMATI